VLGCRIRPQEIKAAPAAPLARTVAGLCAAAPARRGRGVYRGSHSKSGLLGRISWSL
jgi:hypothetical protein